MPQQSVARAETTAAQDSKHHDLKQNFQKEHELEQIPIEFTHSPRA